LGRNRVNKSLNHAGSLEKRQALLAALSRTGAASPAWNEPDGEPDGEIKGYYTLTFEEMAALVNGDMETIESWVNHLDRRHASWLLRWLIKER
jgi:hypothetical protein